MCVFFSPRWTALNRVIIIKTLNHVGFFLYLFLICLLCYLAGILTTRREGCHFGHFQTILWTIWAWRKFTLIQFMILHYPLNFIQFWIMRFRMFSYMQPEANTLELIRILLFYNLLISPSLCTDLLQETYRIKMQWL